MPTSSTVRPVLPPTVWLTRGRHPGPAPMDVLRRHLQRLKDAGTIDDFLEPSDATDAPERVLEARWRVPGGVTVRARLTVVTEEADTAARWVLTAEAEQDWDQRWPSPATMFWPDTPDADWDHDVPTGLRLRDVNRLPAEDRAMRRLLRDAVRGSWNIHVVVHEAMTPDDRGRGPLTPLFPASLRHRVVEHRAAPQQLRAVNWALKECGVQVPRGGAVVLPAGPGPSGHAADEFAVRSVFLDGSEPSDLVDVLTRFVTSEKPLPDGAQDAVTALREQWHLLTAEEELARERELVAMYAEALDAMTKSRDLYKEAAERAHEALAAFRETAAVLPPAPPPSAPAASPLQQLTRTLERLKGTPRTKGTP
ncbi:hypothetical protein [Streptomyces sp. ALI-76-A]|uniref:hypothetical protein n=1 Tax=Streptomyces sp. ALI-76-A TaxID=3025736 RepID=UPI00256F24E6|nr:hypothetical protein [Streptomyces sp. ALI-76-A]MDL5205636.1 hypothetical protein [Streptomyces sp. ALI-76-A]